ncbi:aldo/keto reductase [Phyllobacterium sp. YR531]|uniref:aldo/keto reductase n=1 Tax=Phyllobacterium sp. YR531 TaxID=1144343 RepID=UPI00026F98DF|nr:aldo/keto reductase [Phyllobacterium sp. YR531]EJN02202.1 putative oxidoreductase, aryl-alcohol dehydrogenase like protein [Phyllobacterium sp. YR531]
METRKIGTTPLTVTQFGFGGAAIGGLYKECPRDDAVAALQSAWDAGLRYFDTAPFYGFGLSERRTGDFLRSKPRDSYVLSTKVGRLLRPVPDDQVPDHSYVNPLPFTVDYDYSYDGIMRSFEFSFARLGLNRIDILYVHDIGSYTHGRERNAVFQRQLLDTGMKALEELKASGAISAYGLGVNEVEVCMDVIAHSHIDCILLAGRYSLLDRSAERGLLNECSSRKISLVIGGVFNSGILATGPVPGAHFDYGPASDDVLKRVQSMEALAKAHSIPLAAAALQFPLRKQSVANVLIGTAKAASLTRNMGLLNITIPEEFFTEVEQFAIR